MCSFGCLITGLGVNKPHKNVYFSDIFSVFKPLLNLELGIFLKANMISPLEF